MGSLSSKKYTAEDLFSLASPDGGRFAVDNPDAAYDFCRQRAQTHYENFPVGSMLIPGEQRPHIFAVYAFSRIADDISDELTDYPKEKRIELLEGMKAELSSENYHQAGNPVFMALKKTMKTKLIPPEPLEKLIDAFIMDVNFRQPQDYTDLEYYCVHSANPVGELVLRIFDQYNEKNAYLSDKICTGLQLVNFWQDLSRDMKIGRFYIPENLMNKYKITQENIQYSENSKKVEEILNEIYDYSENFFKIGVKLVEYLKPLRLKAEIAVTIEGGMTILDKTRKLKAEILFRRPKINKTGIISVLIRSLFKHRVLF